jgi:hypothetical protein
MCTIKEVLKYTSSHYLKKDTLKDALPLSQLIKLIYLADWKASLDRGRTITDIEWQIVNGEPKMDEASLTQTIEFFETTLKGEKIVNFFQSFYEGIKKTKLTQYEKSILDFVIDKARSKSSEEFSQLVHSTFPSLTLDESDKVDLPRLAAIYTKELKPGLLKENGLHYSS